MDRYVCLFLALLLLAAGGFAAVTRELNAQSEDVTYSEHRAYGDPRALDGVSVTMDVSYDQRLHWRSTLAADSGACTAELSFSQIRAQEWKRPSTRRDNAVYLFSGVSYTASAIALEDLTEDYLFAEIIKDVYSRTAPGETRTETVHLADYYEFYHLDFIYPSSAALENTQMLNDFFRFPVLPEETVTVTLMKSADGKIASLHQEDDFGLDMRSFFVDAGDCFYLAFFPTVRYSYESGIGIWEEKTYALDFSRIPGGAGVYRLAVEGDDRLLRIENIYPFGDDACQVVSLDISPDRQSLLLLCETDGVTELTVLGSGDGRMIDRFALSDHGELNGCFVHEDGYLVTFFDGSFVFLTPDGAGSYAPAVTSSLSLRTEDGATVDIPFERRNDEYTCDLAWDGERLVLALMNRGTSDCSYTIAVFDKSSMLYAGWFENSVDQGLRIGGKNRPNISAPLNVTIQ